MNPDAGAISQALAANVEAMVGAVETMPVDVSHRPNADRRRNDAESIERHLDDIDQMVPLPVWASTTSRSDPTRPLT